MTFECIVADEQELIGGGGGPWKRARDPPSPQHQQRSAWVVNPGTEQVYPKTVATHLLLESGPTGPEG